MMIVLNRTIKNYLIIKDAGSRNISREPAEKANLT